MSTNSTPTVKRTSRLAVFQHVVEKEKPKKRKKFYTNRIMDDSSPSESELIIDELDDDGPEPVKKKKPLIRLNNSLNLLCDWDECFQDFSDYQKFDKHLIEHARSSESENCKWKDCAWISPSVLLLTQHISYHGYITKLKNIGENVLKRNNWPLCSLSKQLKIPVNLEGFDCLWDSCLVKFFTVYEFYSHVKLHIRCYPQHATPEQPIECLWKGCNKQFSTQPNLKVHLKVHTKERTLACPTCAALFSTSTKFGDHRRRQLSSDQQSYQCSQCLKLFASERLLRDHMRSHINHYKCTMCDMTCPKPSILAKHIRYRHMKSKFYKCDICKKGFVEKQNLRVHILTHKDENMHACSECDFTCRSAYGLQNHMVKNHKKPISQVYECHCCKETFSRGGQLTKHLMKVHNYHWPSGHSRFRYRRDKDGIHRLQTVRYESLEVTEEMIKSESLQTSKQKRHETPKTSIVVGNSTDKSEMEVVVTVDEKDSTSSATSNCNTQETPEVYFVVGDSKLSGSADNSQNKVVVTVDERDTVSSATLDSNNKQVEIVIDDVDEQGNLLKSQVIQSSEIVYATGDAAELKVEFNRLDIVDEVNRE